MSAPSTRSAVYATTQTSTSAASHAITDAIRVTECSITPIVEHIERTGHDMPHDGNLVPLAGPQRAEVNIKFEVRTPGTPGTRTTLQHLALYRACPVSVQDISGDTVLSRLSGRVPFVDYHPATITKYEQAGRRLRATNVTGSIKYSADANGIFMAEFVGKGLWVDDADGDADNVAEVATYTVTTGDAADWTVTVRDNHGNQVSDTVTPAGTSTAQAATALRSATLTPLVAVTGSGDDAIFTSSRPGHNITVTVTPGGSGAGSLAATTAPVSFDEAPTYQNEGEVVVNRGTTFTDSRGTPINIGAWSLDPGVTINDKPSSESASGHSGPRPSAAGYAVFSWSHDVQEPGTFNPQTARKAATSGTLSCAMSGCTVALAQLVPMSSSEGDSAGDRTHDEQMYAGTSSSGASPWTITFPS